MARDPDVSQCLPRATLAARPETLLSSTDEVIGKRKVYGAWPDPELRLITCGGSFAAGHYLDNVVVDATEDGT